MGVSKTLILQIGSCECFLTLKNVEPEPTCKETSELPNHEAPCRCWRCQQGCDDAHQKTAAGRGSLAKSGAENISRAEGREGNCEDQTRQGQIGGHSGQVFQKSPKKGPLPKAHPTVVLPFLHSCLHSLFNALLGFGWTGGLFSIGFKKYPGSAR